MAENKKGRKTGRNMIRCERYKTQDRRTKNKARRLLKHLKMHHEDVSALAAVAVIKQTNPAYIILAGRRAAAK